MEPLSPSARTGRNRNSLSSFVRSPSPQLPFQSRSPLFWRPSSGRKSRTSAASCHVQARGTHATYEQGVVPFVHEDELAAVDRRVDVERLDVVERALQLGERAPELV